MVPQIISQANEFLVSHAGVIGTGVGMLFVVAKAVSNGKAGPIVSKVQSVFDIAATCAAGVGTACKFVSDQLALVLKSDGYAGKQ